MTFHPQLGGTLRFLSLRFSWRIITFFFYAMAFHWQIFGIDMMDYLYSCLYGYIWPTHGFEKEQGKIATKILSISSLAEMFTKHQKMKDFKDLLLFSPSPRKTKSVSEIILSAFFQARPRLRRWGRHAWEKKDSCLQRW